MVISKTLCKSVALREDLQAMNLGKLMHQANQEISRDNPEMLFVTAFVGILDLRSGELTYCNAGHERPLIVAHRCHAQELAGMGGPPLGVMEDHVYQTQHYRLASEEFLCVFSDGITEAFNPAQEQYGRARLVAALEAVNDDVDAQNVLEKVCASVHAFSAGAEPSDDLTVMVVRWCRPAAIRASS
jgi:serine phosphatase RsbU (regulator of sigma subunit)